MEKNISYDLLMLEAERISNLRKKDLDLHYKDANGDFVPLAEAYSENVTEVVSNIFKKRRMRYLITFTDSIDISDDLRPSSHRVLRYFTKVMNYGNIIKNIGVRDINDTTGMSMRYVIGGIRQLCEKDIIRFSIDKGRRTYIVNPTHFYKGSLRSIFKTIRSYDNYPKRNEDFEVEYEHKED